MQSACTPEPWKQHRPRRSRGFASPSESPRAALGATYLSTSPEGAEALDGVCVRGAGGRGSPRPRRAVWVARLPEAQAGSVGGEAPRGPGGQCGWPRLPEAQAGSVGGEARVLHQEGPPPPHFWRCGVGAAPVRAPLCRPAWNSGWGGSGPGS